MSPWRPYSDASETSATPSTKSRPTRLAASIAWSSSRAVGVGVEQCLAAGVQRPCACGVVAGGVGSRAGRGGGVHRLLGVAAVAVAEHVADAGQRPVVVVPDRLGETEASVSQREDGIEPTLVQRHVGEQVQRPQGGEALGFGAGERRLGVRPGILEVAPVDRSPRDGRKRCRQRRMLRCARHGHRAFGPREHLGDAGLLQPLSRVHPEGVEQAVPHADVGVLDDHHRLVHQLGEHAGDLTAVERPPGTDLLDRCEGEGAGEDRQTIEQARLRVGEEPVGPVDHRLQGAMPARAAMRPGGQQLEALVEPRDEILGGQGAQARSGEFDR